MNELVARVRNMTARLWAEREREITVELQSLLREVGDELERNAAREEQRVIDARQSRVIELREPQTYKVISTLYEHECRYGCDSDYAVNCNCAGACPKHAQKEGTLSD